jgi:tetratricopeptide (TPR) repeat protein
MLASTLPPSGCNTACARPTQPRFIMACTLIMLILLASAGALARLPAKGPSYDELLAQARTALDADRPELAVQESEAAIRLNDKRWEGYVTAAEGYSAQGLYEDAVGMFQMALVRAPEEKKDLIRDAIADARKSASAPAAAAAKPQPAAPAPPAPPAHTPDAAPSQAEMLLWKAVESSTHAEDFKAYLQKYPDGVFATIAQARASELEAEVKKQDSEAMRKVQEAQKQVDQVRYTPKVRRDSAFGHHDGTLEITADGAIYRGEERYLSLSRQEITYIELDREWVKFHSRSEEWKFCMVNTDAGDCLRGVELLDRVLEQWHFMPVGHGERFVPSSH